MAIVLEKLCKAYGNHGVLTDFSAVVPEGNTFIEGLSSEELDVFVERTG